MKKIILLATAVVLLSSCGVFGGSNKTGCPANGRSVGAEKLAAGDLKATKAANKAPKFKY